MNTPQLYREPLTLPRPQGVLVAEDEPTDQFLLQRAINQAGLEIRIDFVSDGLEVMDFLQHPPHGCLPALLLLDLKMPRFDGFGVLQWLQHRSELRPGYVVVFSSSFSALDIARASHLGVDHYLVKPTDPVELVGTVKRLEIYWREEPVIVTATFQPHQRSQMALAV